MRDADRLRAAVDALQATMRQLAGDVEGRIGERCPYRTARDHCTFAGGCVNQRRPAQARAGLLTCGGDHLLRRRPSDDEP